MLAKKIIDYFIIKNIWSDSVVQYENALTSIGIDLSSDFAEFYLHADDGPSFYGKKHATLHQLCWHILNTNYKENSESLKSSLGIPSRLILLDSFEGGGGYFYNKETGEVLHLQIGSTLSDFLNGKLEAQWKDFNSFLEYFFACPPNTQGEYTDMS